ncbi:MAG: hypothetical protein DRJ42_26190 [Deltaproteobacteria bacterium]|nr:MAG: hypothetical protein DRJ42_26190 [Deltaproteobacteria bacterium]
MHPLQRLSPRLLSLALLLALLLIACTGDEPVEVRPDAEFPTDSSASDTGAPPDAGPEAPPDGTLPTHARELPFDYQRTDQGAPVSPAELQAVTDRYLEVLSGTRYFDVVAERVHGWPESDPEGRYWYGSWWSGITVRKSGGRVTYHHSADGADNNGLRTAPLLEGACYASSLWGDAGDVHLTRTLMRGFISWSLAMRRHGADPEEFLLSRAAYPESVVDTALDLTIDYSLNRPGEDGSASEYVYIPTNPTWPNLWVKNKRSKDDMGHMLRAIAQLDSCAGSFGDAAAEAELIEMRRLYQGWSRRVEDDRWGIATLTQDHEVTIPGETLAHFVDVSNIECTGILAVRLMGRQNAGGRDCGDGIGPVEEGLDEIRGSNMQILRTFHEAAANLALLMNDGPLARQLLEGLATRLDVIMDRYEAGDPPPNANVGDFAALLIHSANAGVPLTSREVRWLHARIDEAHATYLAPAAMAQYRIFDASTPDGEYLYEPSQPNIDFKDLGALLGSCASQYQNPNGRPLLDCDRVRAAR